MSIMSLCYNTKGRSDAAVDRSKNDCNEWMFRAMAWLDPLPPEPSEPPLVEEVDPLMIGGAILCVGGETPFRLAATRKIEPSP
jgi:hypothetical protein